jgi:AcrR family transcriptional regulator
MSTKTALLEVTARLFACHGWRGTTTRRIAEAAGVNEVTVFRHFRSKEALLGEAISAISREVHLTGVLPESPGDIRRELNEWSVALHGRLRKHGPLILACLAEFSDHPELAPVACAGALDSFDELAKYLGAARRVGKISGAGHIESAVMMLMNAIFMDAVTRDVVGTPRPVEVADAIANFVDLTLRALGAPEEA